MISPHILSGYRILDLTHVLAGPSATRLMVEMGAEVIKVEFPPLGDISRSLPVIKNGRSAYYVQQNRGKKSLSVNIKTAEGKEIISKLIQKSDILIENFAPGVIERLGFGWEDVKKLNSKIIMCSISAFGQSGELSGLPGFDYIAQAYSGIMGMIGERDGPPSFPMAGIGDVMTGVHAFGAIGYALLHRQKSGKGQYLDVSLVDSYMHCHELNISVHSLSKGSTMPTRSGQHHYAVCPLGLFNCIDGYVCIIALQSQWAAFCRAIESEELINDPRFSENDARVENSDELIGIIQRWVDKKGSKESVMSALEAERIPCAPVLDIGEVSENEHFLGRGTVKQVSDQKLGQFLVPGMPLKFSDFPETLNLEAAYLGQHNKAIIEDLLDYGTEDYDMFCEKSILFSNEAT